MVERFTEETWLWHNVHNLDGWTKQQSLVSRGRWSALWSSARAAVKPCYAYQETCMLMGKWCGKKKSLSPSALFPTDPAHICSVGYLKGHTSPPVFSRDAVAHLQNTQSIPEFSPHACSEIHFWFLHLLNTWMQHRASTSTVIIGLINNVCSMTYGWFTRADQVSWHETLPGFWLTTIHLK